MPEQKKKYRALSGGLIARIGTREYTVEKDKIYEWGDEEAEIYLRNAPENFEIVDEKRKSTPVKYPEIADQKKKGGK
ncbi:MAG: hypothetical protein CV087_20845 [Candidatus Brocadia sp. WS118]|nr:MAG: hypothetical protein CV087_20845 [Candidatus Brocadia sp. WS118]